LPWLADVAVGFSGGLVSFTVPFDLVYGPNGPAPDANSIAYAAYFYDAFGMTADVFPNGDGYLISAPEPGTIALMTVGLFAACRSSASNRRRRRSLVLPLSQ
jgi:hypothetical protein